MNYARFMNRISAARKPSPIRKITEITAAGGSDLISFGAGAPNASCFPYESISVRTSSGHSFELTGAALSKALQYGPTNGMPELLKWLNELQKKMHHPWGSDENRSQDIVITPGSQDGLCKIFEMVLSAGDSIVLEEPSYPGTLAGLRPLGLKYVSVETDGGGMRVDSLERAMSKWSPADALNPDSDIPKLIYLQPSSSNPTGVAIAPERRLPILQIAKKYDMLVVEDDPYYYLNFSKDFPRSFLSLDTDGRVLRLDSFSKVLSSGLRLGFVTGPKPLVDGVALHLQVSSMHCSSLSQTLAFQLLNRWGVDGFLSHARGVADFYQSQCEQMVAAANKHLKGLAEWNVPTGGMFLWLKAIGIADTFGLISEKALAKQVVLVPGNAFFVDDGAGSPFLRASFSSVAPTQMDEPNEMMKKRDFMEIDPPQTMTEFYARYDPSIGWGTAIALGSFMVLMVANVAIKWMARRCRRLRHHKWFCKEQAGGGLAQAVSDMHFGMADDLVEPATPVAAPKRVVPSYSDSTCLTSLATTTLRLSEPDMKPYADRTVLRSPDADVGAALLDSPAVCDQAADLDDEQRRLSVRETSPSGAVVRARTGGDVDTVLTTTATIEYRPEVVNNGRSRPNGGPAASALKAFSEQMEESSL